MKWIIIGVSVVCATLVGMGVYFATRTPDPANRVVALSDAYTARLADNGWSEGEAGGVELIEFADLQCPSCAVMHPIIQDALSTMGEEPVRFVFRHYPLVTLHNKARQAALMTEAAGRQGKFSNLKGYLYENQASWSTMTPTQFRSYVEAYLEGIGVNIEQFSNDMDDRRLGDAIDDDVAAASAAKATGTPTLLVNGVKLDPLPTSSDELVQILRAAMPASTPSPTPAP